MPRQSAEEKLSLITIPDRDLWMQSIVFAGMDEAGRGPLAGPVTAGCVIMPSEPLLLGVDDSKKLSEKKRDLLFDQIVQIAIYAKVGIATVEEIEAYNILGATKLAMARAAEGAPCALFLVDGKDDLQLPGERRSIIGGDALCYSIAAASILAKVTRDRMMLELDTRYPQYGFAKHKGYGTKDHIAVIRTQGPCPAHRSLFIRNFV